MTETTMKFGHGGHAGPLAEVYDDVTTVQFFIPDRREMSDIVTPARFPRLRCVAADARTNPDSLLRLLVRDAIPELRCHNFALPKLRAFLEAMRPERLTLLSFGDMAISQEDWLDAIPSLARFTELESLTLSQCRIGAAAVAALSRVTLPKLTHLDLFGDCGGASGAKALASIAGLEVLELAKGRLSFDALDVLSKGRSASTLRRLSVWGSQRLGDDALACLTRFPQLTWVNLGDTGITREAAQALHDGGRVAVSGIDGLRSARTPVVGEGRQDTPKELIPALTFYEPGVVFSELKAGRLSWDGQYDPFTDDDWTNPFHLMAGIGGTKEVKKAVELGRAVDERDPSGRTPLMFACIGLDLRPWDGESPRSGSDKTVKRLLELGADVNAADHAGRRALHHAAYVGAESCVRVLLKAGAVDAPNAEGDLAETLAGQYQHATVKTLIEKAKRKR